MVEEYINFQRRPVAEIQSKEEYGCIICNPPYGERLGDINNRKRYIEKWDKYLKHLKHGVTIFLLHMRTLKNI